MIITVIGVKPGVGTTVSSAMLALSLSLQRKTDGALLTSSKTQNTDLLRIFGKSEVTDLTKSLDQMSRDISVKGADMRNLRSYTNKIFDNLSLYHSGKQNISEDELADKYRTFIEGFDVNNLIIDASLNYEDKIFEVALNSADIIMLSVEQDTRCADEMRHLLKISKFKNVLANKPVYGIYSRYVPSLGHSWFEKMDIPSRRVMRVPYTLQIAKQSNKGMIDMVAERAIMKDGLLLPLRSALQDMNKKLKRGK